MSGLRRFAPLLAFDLSLEFLVDLNGSEAQLDFLPERSTDFVFAVIGEEFGLLGLALLLLLYMFVVGRGQYVDLGPLLIWAVALSFIIPVAAIALFGVLLATSPQKSSSQWSTWEPAPASSTQATRRKQRGRRNRVPCTQGQTARADRS